MRLKAPRRGNTVVGNKDFVWGVRTYVMGVLNVTPDSFSRDGVGNDAAAAVEQALRFQEAGADIVDVGGESTRPPSIYLGAGPITAGEEIVRVVPVIEALVDVLDIPISVDTYKAEVARRAVAAGAAMINDQWALRRDPEMAGVAAEAGVPVVLMHNQESTGYDDLVPDVIDELQRAVDRAVDAGIALEDVIVDPGMGFGKTAEQNLELLRRLDELEVLGRPILVGMSRKSTIGLVLDLPVDERVEGTAATVAFSIAAGADVVRVHDVKEMIRVARMSDAIARGWSQG
jgi:dihydropteroate synthase